MFRNLRVLALTVVLVATAGVATSQAAVSLFFLHHSTGRILIQEGDVRGEIATRNDAEGTSFRFWDHDYNYIGLSNPDGVLLGYNYGPAANNTDPDGLYTLWTTSNSARDSILTNHDVIAFKSCFPACHIVSDAQLEQYQDWYLAMRDVFDQHPGKVFVVMSPPPLHRLATNLAEADRARAFAEWLGSTQYLGGRSNVVCFDLFDHLAHPADGSDTRNMLRWEYENSHSSSDSHPNPLANQTIGPIFAAALMECGEEFVPAEAHSWSDVKSLFR